MTNQFAKYGIKLTIGMQTNATNVNKEKMRIFSKYLTSIGISYDGNSGSNDLRSSNLYEYYNNLFQEIERYNIKKGIITVVTSHNIDKLEENVEKTNINYTYNIFNNPYENIENNPLGKLNVDNDVFDKIYKRQIINFYNGSKYVDGKFRTNIAMALNDFISFHKHTFHSGCEGKICGTAIDMIAVRPNGEVGYCDRWKEENPENFIMNAWDYDFLGAKQLKHAIKIGIHKHNAMKKLGCDTCPADYFCHHGCIAWDYSVYGKYELSDRDCKIYKPMYQFIKDNLIEIFTKLAENNIDLDIIDDFYAFKLDTLNLLKEHNIKLQYDESNNKIKVSIIK